MQSLLLALIWSPPTFEGTIRLFSCYVLHYVHQLEANSAGMYHAVTSWLEFEGKDGI